MELLSGPLAFFADLAYREPLWLVLGSLALPVLILLLHGLLGRRAPEPEVPSAAPVPRPAAPVARPAAPVERAEVPVQRAAPPAARATPPSVAGPPPPARPPRVRLAERLRRTSEALVGRLDGLLGGRTVDNELLDDLEALLFGADLGVETAEGLLKTVRKEASGGDAEAVRGVLRRAIRERLATVEPQGPVLALRGKPHVVLVLGVNGSGKTTTIGKLAARFRQEGRRVILGAGDTFRALAPHLELLDGRKEGGDPAAVAFDTLKAATARGYDVAIIDTAGRLQTKEPLMEELKKIHRVIGREVAEAPHEVLLVLDGNTGQNALSQARLFTEATGVTGLVVTKLDGTAKGGVIVGLADAFHIPVKFIGVGEAVEDLREFRAEEFVAALFAEDAGEADPA